METLKKIWAPVAGFIGAVTLVVQFIQLWKGDQATVTYVFTSLGGILILVGLFWVGIGRKSYEVPNFIEPGKTIVKSDWQYTKKIRYLAYMGLLIYLLSGFVGAFVLLQHRKALAAKTVILVARFDGPEDTYAVTDELLEQLRSTTADYGDIEVIPLGETITAEQGGGHARKVGKRYQADIVIWGWYRETENPNVTLHIENLVPNEIPLINIKDPIKPAATLFDLKSFELQQGLGKEMSAMVLFINGYAHYVSQDFLGALSRFEKALAPSEWSANPINRADALYYRAETHYFLDQYEDAIADYTEAIQLNPKHSLSYLNRGVANYSYGEYEAAIADYVEGMRLKPLEAELAADVYTNLGVAYYMIENYKDAIENYTQAIQLDPKDFLAIFNRCIAHEAAGHHEEAVADCSVAIELEPKDPEPYIDRGIAYNNLNLFQEAISDYQKAIELDPGSVLAHYNSGNTYFSLGQYEVAIESYSQAIRLEPEYASAYGNRGDAYIFTKEYSNAIDDYSMAISLSPDRALNYFKRADVFMSLEQYEKAIEDYTSGFQYDVTDVEAFYLSGLAHYALQQYDTAVSDETQSIKLDPQNVDAYCIRGLSHYELGEDAKELAISDLQTCMEKTGKIEMQQVAEQLLQQLTNP